MDCGVPAKRVNQGQFRGWGRITAVATVHPSTSQVDQKSSTFGAAVGQPVATV